MILLGDEGSKYTYANRTRTLKRIILIDKGTISDSLTDVKGILFYTPRLQIAASICYSRSSYSFLFGLF